MGKKPAGQKGKKPAGPAASTGSDAGEADMFEIEDALEMNQGSVDPSLMAQALQVMERDGAIVQDDYGIYRLAPDSEGSF